MQVLDASGEPLSHASFMHNGFLGSGSLFVCKRSSSPFRAPYMYAPDPILILREVDTVRIRTDSNMWYGEVPVSSRCCVVFVDALTAGSTPWANCSFHRDLQRAVITVQAPALDLAAGSRMGYLRYFLSNCFEDTSAWRRL